jgi:hypothetical protein
MQNCILFKTGCADALLIFSDVSSYGGVHWLAVSITRASLFCFLLKYDAAGDASRKIKGCSVAVY